MAESPSQIFSWRSQWFFLLAQIGALVWACIWSLGGPPSPGYSVAVLAVVAAVMSVHPNMRDWQKLLWMLLIGAFLLVEFRAINKDRQENNQSQAQIRKDDHDSFERIAKGINTSIQQSQDHFTATMSGLEATMRATNQTIINTRPKAVIECTRMEPSVNNIRLTVGSKLGFNVYYTDSGSAPATLSSMYAAVYYCKLDDTACTALKLADFDKQWASGLRVKGGRIAQLSAIGLVTVNPNEPDFDSFFGGPISHDDVSDIANKRKTVYTFVRWSWTDDTGSWLSDYCAGYQDLPDNWAIEHGCMANGQRVGKPRYRDHTRSTATPNRSKP